MSTGIASSNNQKGVHPSAYGSGTIPDTSRTENNPENRSTDDKPNASGTSDLVEDSYPEQKHAGKVGYGPLYNQGTVCHFVGPKLWYDQDRDTPLLQGLTEKIGGIKEQIMGKIRKDPDLVQHGRDRKTGESKQTEMPEEVRGFFPELMVIQFCSLQDQDPLATSEEKEPPSLSPSIEK